MIRLLARALCLLVSIEEGRGRRKTTVHLGVPSRQMAGRKAGKTTSQMAAAVVAAVAGAVG